MSTEKILSWLSVIILVTTLLYSYSINSQANEIYLCEGNDKCVENVVRANGNVTLCEESGNRNLCYEIFALELNKPETCLKSSDKDLCIARYAVFKNDVNTCSYSLTPDLCSFQVASENYNPDACEFAQDSGLCYYSYAVKFRDQKMCEKSEKYKRVCEEKIVDVQ